MEKVTFKLPAMYGDHHVIEVRRLLLDVPGVHEVFASSAFQAVEIGFDPQVVSAATLETALDDAGYMQPMTVAQEAGVAANGQVAEGSFLRHTTSFAQTRQMIGFAQDVTHAGRPLWPCPGMGPVARQQELLAEED